ncbi:MAG: hypothetical protein IJH78_03165 [Clostridia bacterium]|nr:hypothetical protein [Clostridia bacterium]
MDRIALTLWLPDRTRLRIRVPGDMPLEDVLRRLEEKGKLPPVRGRGYRTLRSRADGRIFALSMSAAGNGIPDGDELELYEMEPGNDRARLAPALYGCPTAGDLPGIVPPAMLTREEAAESVEL